MMEKIKERKVLKLKKAPETMGGLIEEAGDQLLPYREGEIVEGKVLSVSRNKIWVDIFGLSLGYVPEKEISLNSDIKVGDKILAYVILLEDDEGNVVLSLKRADRERYWKEMEERFESGDPVEITINEANKGGLISEVGGILGFLPVSQLSQEHYPRVSGGNREEILSRLNKIVGEKLFVKVINCDRPGNKLIFSEKAVDAEKVASKIEKYKVGDSAEGVISGIVDFGLFVKIDSLVEGLVHISEISWSRVNDLHKLFKVGDKVNVSVIAIEDGRLSLSLKRLEKDPWTEAAKKYKVGDVVKGSITKITAFGAFVSLDDQIDGLVHVSELSSQHIIDAGQVVELGKEYDFKIISIEPETHRLGLSLKAARKIKNDENSASSVDNEKNSKAEQSKKIEPKNKKTKKQKVKSSKEVKVVEEKSKTMKKKNKNSE